MRMSDSCLVEALGRDAMVLAHQVSYRLDQIDEIKTVLRLLCFFSDIRLKWEVII